MKQFLLSFICIAAICSCVNAQQKARPEDTEVWKPVPAVVTPGKTSADAPSDAVILFNGKDLSQWVSTSDTTKPAGWLVQKGVITVNKKAGDIQTKASFTDYQLHLEWKVPKIITGKGQARGNSGIFLAALPDGGYELQIMDSYHNETYVNGQAGSLYKQHPPLVNPIRPPGEWQVYDVIWTAPRFNADGTVKSAGKVTAFFNGVVVQNNAELKGTTEYIGQPRTVSHGPLPIRLQAHGDPSEPISFRNIWLRNL
jgi:hypothetical protein